MPGIGMMVGSVAVAVVFEGVRVLFLRVIVGMVVLGADCCCWNMSSGDVEMEVEAFSRVEGAADAAKRKSRRDSVYKSDTHAHRLYILFRTFLYSHRNPERLSSVSSLGSAVCPQLLDLRISDPLP